MLTDREIISTLEMLENENLDVRTVTLGISLFDCASHDPEKVKNKIFTRITQFAENLVPVCDRIGEKYGIPVVNKRIAVSPIAVVGAAHSSSQMVDIAKTLDAVAEEVNVDFIGGFSALVQKGIARGDRALIEAIPHECHRAGLRLYQCGLHPGRHQRRRGAADGQHHQTGGQNDRRKRRPGLRQTLRFCQHTPGHPIYGRGLPGCRRSRCRYQYGC